MMRQRLLTAASAASGTLRSVGPVTRAVLKSTLALYRSKCGPTKNREQDATKQSLLLTETWRRRDVAAAPLRSPRSSFLSLQGVCLRLKQLSVVCRAALGRLQVAPRLGYARRENRSLALLIDIWMKPAQQQTPCCV